MRRLRTFGAVSFLAFLCPAVRPLWDFVFDRWATLDPDGARGILDEQLLRLRRLREGARGPFVVVGYYVEDEAIRARLEAEPSIRFVDLHVDPAEALPGDGHPAPGARLKSDAS